MTTRMLGVAVFNCCCLLALLNLGNQRTAEELSPYTVAIMMAAIEVACLLGVAYWVRCYARHPGRKTTRGLFRVEVVAFVFFTAQCLLGVRILTAYLGVTP